MVPSDEPGLHRRDVSGSEFEVGVPTSEEEVEKCKSRSKRTPKVISRLYLRVSCYLFYIAAF